MPWHTILPTLASLGARAVLRDQDGSVAVGIGDDASQLGEVLREDRCGPSLVVHDVANKHVRIFFERDARHARLHFARKHAGGQCVSV